MNKTLVRKMIKRIKSVPESYNQHTWFIAHGGSAPCGTVACLAGEAIICNAKTVKEGIRIAFENYDDIPNRAERLLGLPPNEHSVFAMDGSGWPKPHSMNFKEAATPKDRASVAVEYLTEALKRGEMLW